MPHAQRFEVRYGAMKRLLLVVLLVAMVHAGVAQTMGSTTSNAPTGQQKRRQKIDFDKIVADVGNGEVRRNAPPLSFNGIEILSATHGFDLTPYMRNAVEKIRKSWYENIPESARAPQLKRGMTTIKFVIEKDGKVTGMDLEQSSDDIELDRAVWKAIRGNKFSKLPEKLDAPYLALRIRFQYNPDSAVKQGIPDSRD
jgi:TonB family protein